MSSVVTCFVFHDDVPRHIKNVLWGYEDLILKLSKRNYILAVSPDVTNPRLFNFLIGTTAYKESIVIKESADIEYMNKLKLEITLDSLVLKLDTMLFGY